MAGKHSKAKYRLVLLNSSLIEQYKRLWKILTFPKPYYFKAFLSTLDTVVNRWAALQFEAS